MKISEILTSIASWLENPNNEAVLLAEYNEECLKTVSESLVEAAAILKTAAEKTDLLEPQEESKLTLESLDEIATLASEFDKSGDEFLMKQASVLDEILLTIGAPNGVVAAFKAAEDKKIDVIKNNYKKPKEEIDKANKVAEVEKAIKDSGMTKHYKILEHELNSRYCPDHSGTMLGRVEENVYQCPLDGKTFNFAQGYTLENGDKVPGGSVTEQTPMSHPDMHQAFDDRPSRLEKSRT